MHDAYCFCCFLGSKPMPSSRRLSPFFRRAQSSVATRGEAMDEVFSTKSFGCVDMAGWVKTETPKRSPKHAED